MSARIPRLVLSPILLVVLTRFMETPGVSGAQAPPDDEGSITPPPVGEPEGKGDVPEPARDPGSPDGGPDSPGTTGTNTSPGIGTFIRILGFGGTIPEEGQTEVKVR